MGFEKASTGRRRAGPIMGPVSPEPPDWIMYSCLISSPMSCSFFPRLHTSQWRCLPKRIVPAIACRRNKSCCSWRARSRPPDRASSPRTVLGKEPLPALDLGCTSVIDSVATSPSTGWNSRRWWSMVVALRCAARRPVFTAPVDGERFSFEMISFHRFQ